MGIADAAIIAAGAAGVVLLYIGIKKSIYTVDQGTVKVITRWGKHSRVLTAGLHFRLMFADKVRRIFNSQRQSLRLEVLANSGEQIPVTLTLELEVQGTLETEAVEKLAYEIANPAEYLMTTATTAARELLLPMTYDDIFKDEGLADQFEEKLTSVTGECGFKLLRVRITSIRRPETLERALIAAAEAATVRDTREKNAKSENELRKAAARAEADAANIQNESATTQLKERAELIRELLVKVCGEEKASEVDLDHATQIVEAMLYEQMVNGLNGQGSQILLLPPGAPSNPLNSLMNTKFMGSKKVSD